jgi:hypothetical protein
MPLIKKIIKVLTKNLRKRFFLGIGNRNCSFGRMLTDRIVVLTFKSGPNQNHSWFNFNDICSHFNET